MLIGAPAAGRRSCGPERDRIGQGPLLHFSYSSFPGPLGKSGPRSFWGLRSRVGQCRKLSFAADVRFRSGWTI